uniref:Cathepsin B n=3 Tax=Melanaphis sacchari TaxID=742174 RepID=A0A2H8TZ17_9HEMI
MIFKFLLILVFVTYVTGRDIKTNYQYNENDYFKLISEPALNNKGNTNLNSYGDSNSVYYTNGLPRNFDSRKKWPKCPSIGHIYNQGNCHSSYAISVASAVTDRLCIHSNGTKNPIMSAQQIISCCYLCGYGCNGGSQFESWDFYRRHGFVSGGDYNSSQGCQPYKMPPCKLTNEEPSGHSCKTYRTEETPKCEMQCYNPNYYTSFKTDIYKGKYYQVYPYMAMKEIFDNGPITTQFFMYDDLVDYKSGVYKYDEQSDVPFFTVQSVKVFGWGEENGVPYWLVANSFGSDWGDNGTFKISRGNDGCFFQEKMFAGLPL